jgi:hypothetical protein
MSTDNNAPRRTITAPVVQHHGPSVGKVLAVGGASTLINGTVVGLMLGISMLLGANLRGSEAKATPDIQQTTEVEDTPKEFDLTNEDIGLDSSVPLNYNVDRIEEVSVPGPVDVTQATGVQGAPEAPPSNVPPPPGSGGGSGGAPTDLSALASGNAFGTMGGMGGPGGAGGFAGRSGSTRVKMLTEGGGNDKSEAAVASGLRWLAHHQWSDGHWGLHDFNKAARTAPIPAGKVEGDNSTPNTTRRNDTAGTAFGLLPFLAAGITHKPPAKKTDKDYSKSVNAGLRWLIAKQTKSGNDRGYYGGDMYSHGLATIAMCEAYGLTSDPLLKASAQMALDYVVRAQHEAGGWRYAPRQAGDTSVTGWQLMALKSGQMAGLSVPKKTLTLVGRYLDSVETSDKGGYGYTDNRGGSQAMTAVGALCRQYLGTNPLNPSLLASVRKLKQVPPTSNAGIYYEYYATQVMHHMGGEHWQFWNLGAKGTGEGGIRNTLINRQEKGGANSGSFPGTDHGSGGRLGATSLSLLTLEVYYRHLPLYRREAGMDKPEDK